MIYKNHMVYPVAIIGAGPAGCAAAIQLRRSGIRFLLIEGNRIGGLVRSANLIENYPGFPFGISGPDLASLFENQLNQLKVNIIHEVVNSLDYDETVYKIDTENGVYLSNNIILASGTRPKPIPIEVSIRLRNKVISDIDPIFGIKNERVLIVGAGDAAFDYALNLAKWNTVEILNHHKTISCLPLLTHRAFALDSISYTDEIIVTGVKSKSVNARLHVMCERKGKQSVIPADYLLFAIGRNPNLSFLSDRIRNNERHLKRSGSLYYAGDVKNGFFRQTVIAAGDGLRAAMEISNALLESQ
jgi:thioredoxin reductase